MICRLGLIAAIVLAMGSVRCDAGLVMPFTDMPKVELQLDMGDQQPVWTLARQRATEARYTCQGYVLDLKLDKSGTQKLLRFKLTMQDGSKVALRSYSAKAFAPLAGLHAVMVPCTRSIGHQLDYYHEHRRWRENVPLYHNLIPEGFQEKAIVDNEAPFILLTDNQGNNGFAVGWALADTATWLKGERDGDHYVLSLRRTEDQPFAGTSIEDTLIIDAAKQPWMDAETSYAKQFDMYNHRKHDPAPAWAYEPVFCTWYCYSEDINQDLMLKVAGKCKDLGIDTILIDAGWDAKPGVNWGNLNKGAMGDYAASPELFPDLPGIVKQMHEMGLRVELWASPFWQAKGSKTYQETTKDWMIWSKDGADDFLCPKVAGTRGLLKDKFAWIARTYGIDGMWLDVCDGVAPECTAKHEHLDQPMGAAWVDCMSAIRDGLRSVNPNAITEARILHANLNSKVALDIVQCGDSPKSYEMIRLALIHLKPWAYDVVVKNDPMIWPKNAHASTVGKFLATMVTMGVPALSVDFHAAPEEQCRMVKAWLGFYKQHRQTLAHGDFRLFGANYAIPDMMRTGSDEAVVYIKNPKTSKVDLPKQVKRVFLLNCTDSDNVTLNIATVSGACEITCYKPDWSETGLPSSARANGTLRVSHFVPQGGAMKIEIRP